MRILNPKRFSYFLGLVALILLSNLGVPAWAVTTQNYQQKGLEADASWFLSDECSFTSASITAMQNATLGRSNDSTTLVLLSLGSFNFCTFESTYVSGTATTGMQISAQGPKSASLTGSATIPCDGKGCYIDPESHTVSLDISWMASGNLTRTQSTNRFQDATGMFMIRQSGTSAPAIANGTMTVDGTSFSLGNSYLGDLMSNDSGSITVFRQ